MTEMQKIVYLQAQIVSAQLEAKGMEAENQHGVMCGNHIVYGDSAFFQLADKYGLTPKKIEKLFEE